MARHPNKQPTEVELEILGILWEEKMASARQVHERLSRLRETNYSTTVKMLAVMSDKGLVKRNESQRPILFSAAQSKKKTQVGILKEITKRAYDGSTGSLIMQALSTQKASSKELTEIRKLLDQLESEKDK